MTDLKSFGLTYLVTPYTKFKPDICAAYKEAARLAGRLMKLGAVVYSPIAHSHPVAIYGDLDPLDHSIWLPANQALMEAAQTFLIAVMDGWKDSKGIAHEIEWAKQNNKPIYYLDPATLEIGSEA